MPGTDWVIKTVLTAVLLPPLLGLWGNKYDTLLPIGSEKQLAIPWFPILLD